GDFSLDHQTFRGLFNPCEQSGVVIPQDLREISVSKWQHRLVCPVQPSHRHALWNPCSAIRTARDSGVISEGTVNHVNHHGVTTTRFEPSALPGFGVGYHRRRFSPAAEKNGKTDVSGRSKSPTWGRK